MLRVDRWKYTNNKIDNKEKLRNSLEELISVYPFNEYEYIISIMLGLGKITMDDYLEIRDEYIARNMYLYIFEISAPRGFGEQWAQGHLMELAPEFIKPTKKLEENYSGEYDFLYPLSKGKMIKIEVIDITLKNSAGNDKIKG